jgi:glutathione S-transferase
MSHQVTLYYFTYSFYSQKARIYLKEKGVDFQEELVDLMKLDNLSESFLRLNPKGQVPVLKHGDTVIPDSHDIFMYGEKNLAGKNLLPDEHRKDILQLHSEINEVDPLILLYGCVTSEKYKDGTKLPQSLRERLIARVTSPDTLKEVESKLSELPSDLKEVGQAKSKKIHDFVELCSKPDTLEKELAKVEKVLQRVEKQLAESKARLQGAGSNNAITMLFLHQPTLADIDLVGLLYRVKILGLGDTYVTQEKVPNVCRFYRQFESRPSFQHAYGTSPASST